MTILPRLKAKTSKIQLYHSFGENTKSIFFNKHIRDGKYMGYYLNINKDTVFHFSPEEIYVLCILFEDAIPKIVRWDLSEFQNNSISPNNSSGKNNDISTRDINEDGFSDEFKNEESEADEFKDEVEESSDTEGEEDEWV